MRRHSERLGPIRVVTLVDGIGVSGGGERLARELTVRLDPDRIERTLCVSRWSPEIERQAGVSDALAELRDAGVRFISLPRRSRHQIGPWRRLASLLRRERIDVLHAHKFGSNVWGAMLSSLARVPVFVAHEHTWSFEGQPIRRFLDRHLIARRADAFVAVSRADRRRMIEIERIDPEKALFIPNGIPPSPPPSSRNVRQELAITPDGPVIVAVSALRPQKALEVLVRASATIRDRFADATVLIVGGGAEENRLRALIGDLGLNETVRMLGRRTDVPDILRASTVAVSSSDFEGSPLSIMEYMEAGLPVVATRVGGVPDQVEDGVTGLLVSPRDPAALAGAVARLLEAPEVAREMGQRGRERRRDEFNLETMARRVERLYESLLSRSGGPP